MARPAPTSLLALAAAVLLLASPATAARALRQASSGPESLPSNAPSQQWTRPGQNSWVSRRLQQDGTQQGNAHINPNLWYGNVYEATRTLAVHQEDALYPALAVTADQGRRLRQHVHQEDALYLALAVAADRPSDALMLAPEGRHPPPTPPHSTSQAYPQAPGTQPLPPPHTHKVVRRRTGVDDPTQRS